MEIPIGAAGALQRYLDAVDATVPELIVALYATGSLALGDYHADRSDIDVVVAVAHEPDAKERSLLAEVHRVVATRVDGPYVPADALALPPGAIGPVAFHVDNRFEFGPCHEVSPITWAILAGPAIVVRGPAPSELGVHADVDAVKAFSAANLQRYWRDWAGTIELVIADADPDDRIDASLVEWGVLGAARVLCAARTGEVVSKRASGEWSREQFGPEWHDLLDLAIAARDRDIETVRVSELRRATEFVGAAADCVSDATDRR